MPINKKSRAYLITFLLLVSIFSAINITNPRVKAEDTENKTTLYFHDIYIEEGIENQDILNIIQDYLTLKAEKEQDWNETEDFEELIEEFYLELEEEMIKDDYYNMTEEEQEQWLLDFALSNPKYLPIISLFFDIDNFFVEMYKFMDTNIPTKTNESEHPATINFRKIIETLVNENSSEDPISILEDLSSIFSPFSSIYVYDGNKKDMKGDVEFKLYYNRPITYFWTDDIIKVNFSIISINDDKINYKVNRSQDISVSRGIFSKPFRNPVEYDVSFNVDTELEPFDIVLIKIDRIVGDKLILDPIAESVPMVVNLSRDKIIDILGDIKYNLSYIGDDLSNTNLTIEFAKDIIVKIGSQLLNFSERINETMDTINDTVNLSRNLPKALGINIYEDIIKQLISSTLVYDSVEHPSSVTLPINIEADDEDDDAVATEQYYLHEESMDKKEPAKDEVSTLDLSDQVGEWVGPELNRNKIIKGATANIYLDYRDLRSLLNFIRGKINLVAEIYAGETLIDSSIIELERTSILKMLETSNEAVQFVFEDLNNEIKHGNSLKLKVFAGNSTKFGPLKLYRKVDLYYDSKEYPSSLIVELTETDNIKMKILGNIDRGIVVGGSTEYILNITTSKKYADNVDIDFTINEQEGDWLVTSLNDSVSIPKNGYKLVHIFVNNTDNSSSDYGNFINLTFTASGKTGIDREYVKVELSEEAVEQDIHIRIRQKPDSIKHGSSDTFEFIIKNNNNGFWPDEYEINVVSKQGFNLNVNYNETELEDMEAGETASVYVKLYIPWYTDISSDKLTLTVTSLEDDDIFEIKNITVSIITPNILEGLYNFFEDSAESMGLDEILGGYAAAFLIFIILFLIFFFIAIAIILLTRKHIQLICTNRVAKINPEEQAEFEIAIRNPTKHVLTYQISAEIVSPSSDKWEHYLTPQNLVLDPKRTQMIKLIVKPNDYVKNDDWAEIKITARALEKNKTTSLSTITTITSEEKPRLKVLGVVHWPKVFKKGDRVVTSFRLENKAKIAATNVSVILYVNGEEKNKVEDITIPSGGYADIEMPWIAVKGKNEVNIVVI